MSICEGGTIAERIAVSIRSLAGSSWRASEANSLSLTVSNDTMVSQESPDATPAASIVASLCPGAGRGDMDIDFIGLQAALSAGPVGTGDVGRRRVMFDPDRDEGSNGGRRPG